LVTEKYIFLSSSFDEVCFHYLDKVQTFHKYYIQDLLISGNCSDLFSLGDFEVHNNENYNDSYLVRVFEELVFHDPLVLITHKDGRGSSNVSAIYYLNKYIDTEGFYMTEGFKDLDLSNESIFRIHKMNEDCNLESINNFWLE